MKTDAKEGMQVEEATESLEDTTTKKVESGGNDDGRQQSQSSGEKTSKDAEDDDAEVMDEYSYLERDGFTTELFKIKLSNLTRHASFSSLKKFIQARNLKPRKVKMFRDDEAGTGFFAFITFSNAEDQEAAMKVLDGHYWKGLNLVARKAKPKPDPFQMQRKRKELGTGDGEPLEKKEKPEDDGLTPEERLKNSVTPLWKLSYEEQLETKTKVMHEFIKRLGRNMEKLNKDLGKWLGVQRNRNEGLCCKLEPIKPSPVQEGYRNKSEFTIGKPADGNESIVGFRYGKYRNGTCSVGEPQACRNVSKKSLELTEVFQNFVRSQPWDSYDPTTSAGHWKMLLARTASTGDMLACAEFHPQDMPADDVTKVKEAVKEYFTSGPGAEVGVTGMMFHATAAKVAGTGDKTQRELLFGKPHIQEKLLDLTFQISPDAFFQVNTLGAEVLYSTINEWCNISKDATVLDVCCGTGTIGLTMAKHVKKVIGVDICQEAIDDAEANAALNGVKNTEYICGKAEDVMPGVIRNLFTKDIIAIVDPPRAGLNQKVIQNIRKYPNIDKLIYVSCNPTGAMQNFECLVRPQSKKVKGMPFVPVRAVPVDLFPDTAHCELVTLFERYSEDKLNDTTTT